MTWLGSTWFWLHSWWWVANWLVLQESLLLASWSQTWLCCLSPFAFRTLWPRICIPCLILLVQSMLICKDREKMILRFWHLVSQPYLAWLGFPWCLDIGSVTGLRPGLYGVQWTLGAEERVSFMSSLPDASERLVKTRAFILHSENGFLLCPALFWCLPGFLDAFLIPPFSDLSCGMKLNRLSQW